MIRTCNALCLSALFAIATTSAFAQEPSTQEPPSQPAPETSTPAPTATLSVAKDRREFRVLSTSKTSTMQKEVDEAAAAGFRFVGVMGGGTTFGGSEVLSLMERPAGTTAKAHYEYKLLATNKTSTMQKELDEAGDAGFEYVGQTVYDSRFGGDEVVVILERDLEPEGHPHFKYLVLATKKTSTMQKELQEAGDQGFRYLGVTVSKTAFGGNEVVTLLSRRADQ